MRANLTIHTPVEHFRFFISTVIKLPERHLVQIMPKSKPHINTTKPFYGTCIISPSQQHLTTTTSPHHHNIISPPHHLTITTSSSHLTITTSPHQAGKRDKINVHYMTSLPAIFGIPKYSSALTKLAEERFVLISFFNHDVTLCRHFHFEHAQFV